MVRRHVQGRGRVWAGRFAAVLLALACAAPTQAACGKPDGDANRLIVLTDIGNEPDDSESLVRLLLYAGEIDIQGLVATTSVWQRDRVRPDLIDERIAAYAKVLPNLRVHDCRFPAAAALRDVVRTGASGYGMTAVGNDRETPGSRLIVDALSSRDPRPLWVDLWGGATDLAQALWTMRRTLDAPTLARTVCKLRVYAISDQDDAGPWIRRIFPDLFWIGSLHALNDYSLATWNGISGEMRRQPAVVVPSPSGPDSQLVTNSWIDAHVRRGPLGLLYPPWSFIMEGDTPSFLNLVRNGLSDPEHPEWGGWGGRYGKISPADGLYTDAVDAVTGLDGKLYRDNQATIWRWRAAYQGDFAARIGWTLAPHFADGHHPPIVRVNGSAGDTPLVLRVVRGTTIMLDASGSRNPDGGPLTYAWAVYPEAAGDRYGPPVPIVPGPGAHASITMPIGRDRPIHVILSVGSETDLPIIRYRRIILEPVTGS